MAPEIIKLTADVISALGSGGAAGLWLWSATVKTPKQFPIVVVSPVLLEQSMALPLQSRGESKELTELGNALNKQSRISAWAAGAAALAATAQVISLFAAQYVHSS